LELTYLITVRLTTKLGLCASYVVRFRFHQILFVIEFGALVNAILSEIQFKIRELLELLILELP